MQVDEDCYDAVEWARTSGIYSNPEWYHGLTAQSSFEDFQNYFYVNRINDGVCGSAPCVRVTATSSPLCTSRGNCSGHGVNVFGADGFEDDAAVKRAVDELFRKGLGEVMGQEMWHFCWTNSRQSTTKHQATNNKQQATNTQMTNEQRTTTHQQQTTNTRMP